jgi:hypothetical protein
MAVKRRIGEALSGFVEGFLPAWQQQEYVKRMERGEARVERRDLADDLASEQELLRSEFRTQDDVEAGLSRILDLNPGADRDTVREALEGALLSDERRVAALFRQLDPVQRLHMTPESIIAQAPGVGLTREAFQLKNLPSRSLMGVLTGKQYYPGTPPPQLMTPLKIAGEGPEIESPPSSRILPWSDIAPLVQESRWGGPVAEQFEALQAGGLEAQKAAWDAQQEREILYRRQVSEQEFEIEGEQADEATQREIKHIMALSPVHTLQEMNNLRERLGIQNEFTKRAMLDPDLRNAVLEDQRRLALMQAVLLREPSFYHRFDLVTQKQRTFMGSFTEEGKFRIEEVGAFVGVPYSAALLTQDNRLKDLLVNLSVNGGFDITTQEGLDLFVENASQFMSPDQAKLVGINIAAQVRGDAPSDPGPPVSDEVSNDLVNKYYPEGPPVVVSEDSQMGPLPSVQGDLALPYDTYKKILGSRMGSGDDANLFGTRQAAPGLREMTIDLGRIGRMMNRVSPRYVNKFLSLEGVDGTVLDWLTNQTALDPQITSEVIESMLYDREGYKLLVNAWNSSQAVP